VKRRRVETAVGLDRPAIPPEFHDILSHVLLPDKARRPCSRDVPTAKVVLTYIRSSPVRESSLTLASRSSDRRCQPMAFML
jgi:hypothetical protein